MKILLTLIVIGLSQTAHAEDVDSLPACVAAQLISHQFRHAKLDQKLQETIESLTNGLDLEIRPLDSASSADFNSGRVNVYLDKDDKIMGAVCG
jgi:hypothetical protein